FGVGTPTGVDLEVCAPLLVVCLIQGQVGVVGVLGELVRPDQGHASTPCSDNLVTAPTSGDIAPRGHCRRLILVLPGIVLRSIELDALGLSGLSKLLHESFLLSGSFPCSSVRCRLELEVVLSSQALLREASKIGSAELCRFLSSATPLR